jgi:2-polyprenyl-6-methoxyphenol hydroxylase-like FAD-dependent oxidoreductase
MNPTGGAGALTAMHDAVTLANWINTIEFPSVHNVDAIFKEYRKERHPVAKESFETSQLFSSILGKVRSHYPLRICVLLTLCACNQQLQFVPENRAWSR